MPATSSRSQRVESLARLIDLTRDDPYLFNTAILGSQPYWSGRGRGILGQREWADAVTRYAEVCLVTGNNLGKSHLTYSLALWWSWTRANAITLVFAPSLATLLENTWSGISRILQGYTFNGVAYGPRVDLGARISRGGQSRPAITFPNGSRIIGIAANREENCSGFHAPDLFVICEESSGLPSFVFDAIGGLGPRRTLLVGNPLSTNCEFYSRYQLGVEARRKNLPPSSSSISIQVPSTASPHSHLDHSPWGIADRTFLARKREEEGENSHWYRSHILAQWPTSESEVLIPIDDLDYACSEECRVAAEAYRARAKPGENPVCISADVGLGVGKSRSVVVVRDAYGMLELAAGDAMGVDATAEAIARLKAKYSLRDSWISFDGSGDVGRRLESALSTYGVQNAWPFYGGDSSQEWGKHYSNARSSVAYAFARRLARGFFPGVPHGAPFHVVPDKDLIAELKELRGVARGDGKSSLEDKEVMKARLKRSPDYADAVTQSFLRDARRK